MSVKESVGGQIEKAKEFADKLQKVYRDAYQKALEATSDRVDGLKKMGEKIGSESIRGVVSDKVNAAHTMVDSVNQSLAEKAIPKSRKPGSKQ